MFCTRVSYIYRQYILVPWSNRDISAPNSEGKYLKYYIGFGLKKLVSLSFKTRSSPLTLSSTLTQDFSCQALPLIPSETHCRCRNLQQKMESWDHIWLPITHVEVGMFENYTHSHNPGVLCAELKLLKQFSFWSTLHRNGQNSTFYQTKKRYFYFTLISFHFAGDLTVSIFFLPHYSHITSYHQLSCGPAARHSTLGITTWSYLPVLCLKQLNIASY